MRSVLVLAAAAMVSVGAYAQATQSEQDHVAHHPEATSAPASAAKKAPTKARASAPNPQAAASGAWPASSAMGMGGGNMQQMHDEMHKPGGMHDQMHGKDGQMMNGMPASPAASK
ncbi:MAG TPA: hypothetical protein VFP68_01770 [Burkholderiaceae bacterium]|nr:hypothetical protein [Burkholderiaceae bacterium]